MTITLTREQAQTILDFHEAIEAADNHYKSCQSGAFKSFAHSQLSSMHVEEAFQALRKQMEKVEVPEKTGMLTVTTG